MIVPGQNIVTQPSVQDVNTMWWWQNFGEIKKPTISDKQIGFVGINPELMWAKNTALELSIAGNKSSLMNYSKTGKSEQKSNFLVSKCYNNCGILHPFSADKRNKCREQCDKDAAAEQQQQQQINQVISTPSSTISNGVIWGIVGGIVLLSVGGVLLIRKMKKK